MRHRARWAAVALAALAFAAAGCDLVSSVTPFGLGSRGADESKGTYSGHWIGATSTAGEVVFTVRSGEVVDLVLTHTLSCGLPYEVSFTDPLPIEGDGFSGDLTLSPQGRVFISARFTSPESVNGSYTLTSLPSSPPCPTSDRGTFTAGRVPQANP